MYTEHSVVYEEGPSRLREVTREVFTGSQGRILGTETTVHRWFEGEKFGRGWRWRGEAPVTKAFHTREEAAAWIDEMFRDHQVWSVARNGGTKLVIAT